MNGPPKTPPVPRRRTTSRLVLFVDRLARLCITGGGLMTIGSVLLVCVFLVWVVLPLFQGGDAEPVGRARALRLPQRVLFQGQDPYRELAFQVAPDGLVSVFATADGASLTQHHLGGGEPPVALAVHTGMALSASAGGTLRLVRLAFESAAWPTQDAPPAMRDLAPGQSRREGDAIFTCPAPGQVRRQAFALQEDLQIELGPGSPIGWVDFVEHPTGVVVAALRQDGTLQLRKVTEREDQILMETVRKVVGGDLVLPPRPATGPAGGNPDWLQVGGIGDLVLLVWRNGDVLRIDARDPEAPQIAERLDLLPEPDARVTAVSFLIGRSTLLLGDSEGRVHAAFLVREPVGGEPGADGAALVVARHFRAGGTPTSAPVTVLDSSQRSRIFLAGHADGALVLYQATSENVVASAQLPTAGPVAAASIAPKEDGIMAAGGGHFATWDLQVGHPEFNLRAILRPIWYENAAEAEHVWQSTSGTDDFEPKFGLWPLVFGTLKATFYCMLFGVPIALLAAIYTSEFLHPRTRGRIKPAIELMASLPSVVLGFLAALVFAPVVEEWLTTILAAVLAMPLALLLGAQVWQRVPHHWRTLCDRLRVPAVALALGLGCLLALWAGPAVERALFAGDLKAWLAESALPAPQRSSAFGGWFLLCLPLAVLLAALFGARLGGTFTRRALIVVPATVVLTFGLAGLGTAAGFDLRGGLVGTYDQRNSLVIGFVMGFAVIPIIYTIAEDALSAVPEHLRAASLGAGATPWQTAMRIILPTAMSGIFSAVMIGLGRAVGETMIVLMAAGNTPVLEMNVFNGLRTLSANIATELPEAVRDSTHYRLLYLAALALFVLTFLLNTMAEVVRQRFRRRAYQL